MPGEKRKHPDISIVGDNCQMLANIIEWWPDPASRLTAISIHFVILHLSGAERKKEKQKVKKYAFMAAFFVSSNLVKSRVYCRKLYI